MEKRNQMPCVNCYWVYYDVNFARLRSPCPHLWLLPCSTCAQPTQHTQQIICRVLHIFAWARKVNKKTQKRRAGRGSEGQSGCAASKCGASSVISCHRPIKRSTSMWYSREACDPIPDVPYRRGLSCFSLPSLTHVNTRERARVCVCVWEEHHNYAH